MENANYLHEVQIDAEPENLNTLWGSEEDKDLHVVISTNTEGDIHLSPSRPVNRHRLIGVVADALAALTSTSTRTVHPDQCNMKLIIALSRPDEI